MPSSMDATRFPGQSAALPSPLRLSQVRKFTSEEIRVKSVDGDGILIYPRARNTEVHRLDHATIRINFRPADGHFTNTAITRTGLIRDGFNAIFHAAISSRGNNAHFKATDSPSYQSIRRGSSTLSREAACVMRSISSTRSFSIKTHRSNSTVIPYTFYLIVCSSETESIYKYKNYNRLFY